MSARTLARVHQLHHAFVASSELRPMAQQLMTQRTPAAYAGVLHYARAHTGEASAAAYMALGEAYSKDQKYREAADAFEHANHAGKALDDYSDFLGAQALFAEKQYPAAQARLYQFSERHADSVLIGQARLLQADVTLAQGDPQSALRTLAPLKGSGLAGSSKYLLALGQANQLAGNRVAAQRIYTKLYLDYATSGEAQQAVSQLHQMGIDEPFTPAQSIEHADALDRAKRYADAAGEYRKIANNPATDATQRNELLAKAAVADYRRTHRVDLSQLAQLHDTPDNAGAIRLYLMVEAARDRNDAAGVKALIDQSEQRFPTNEWTAHALFSAGNMALLVNDRPSAIRYYGDLAQRFPDSAQAPLSHWHAAWLNYRLGDKKTAAQLFDEQIERYPQDANVAAALYWRGVIYQEVEKNPAAAAACFQKLTDGFQHYYYATLARQRLADLGKVTPAALPLVAQVADPAMPQLSDDVPQDDIHVERARLLANAGLNQYIAPEMSASEDSAEWRAYAEAQLYSSYGENWRALQTLKRKVRTYSAIPIDAMPRSYWDLLFPQPYWPALTRASRQNGLDPFLVAALIRQESEFNAGVVSYANAWGLMQLLPRVGRELARQQRVRHFRTAYLLDPDVNLKLGAVYLKQLLDEFNGQPEYALAAYNAGDDRVKAWLANGPYASMPEFVESIPFTQTREYVQAILRNKEIYRELYAGNRKPVKEESANGAENAAGSTAPEVPSNAIRGGISRGSKPE